MYTSIYIDNLSKIQNSILSKITLPSYTNATLFYPTENKNLVTEVVELTQLLTTLELLSDVLGVAVIVVDPKTRIPIHKDTGNYTYSLNVPLLGYKNTFLNFYKTDSNDTTVEVPKQLGHASGIVFKKFDYEKCVLIESHETNSPYIMNTQIPHDVHNPNDYKRLFLLIRIDNSQNYKIEKIIKNTNY